MNNSIATAQKVGGVVVMGSTTLATMYSHMDPNLAIPLNSLVYAVVGLFIRWVEKKIFKQKVIEETLQGLNSQPSVQKSQPGL